MKKLYLANPRGFCAGVVRAIDAVEDALQRFGAPIYVKHEIVHNRIVVDDLRQKGAIFIENLEDVPPESILIFSAHGVSPEVKKRAANRRLKLIDATCGLVTRVHSAILRHAKKGYHILLIGHKNHVEVQGSYGHAPDCTTIIEKVEDVQKLDFSHTQKLFMVTQTTLSLLDCDPIFKAIKNRFPNVETLRASSICYATSNRQLAIIDLCQKVDLCLVVGDPMSSNSKRLVEVAARQGVQAFLIKGPLDIQSEWIKKCFSVAVTAGASTPEKVVEECVDKIMSLEKFAKETYTKIEENVTFAPPKVSFVR